MEIFEGKAVFYYPDDAGKFTDVIIKDSGISFDMTFLEQKYTVTLEQRQGSLFKGTALHNLSRQHIPVTARVVKDPDTGIVIISGTEWMEDGKNWPWFAEISPK